MLEFCEVMSDDASEVEFDAYVPFTVTWGAKHRLLETPIYVMCVAGSTMLEWKFGPGSRRLVEVVLVNAPAVRRESGALLCDVVGSSVGVCWSGSVAGERFDLSRGMEVVGWDDCLVVRLSAEPVVRWRGGSSVFLRRR